MRKLVLIGLMAALAFGGVVLAGGGEKRRDREGARKEKARGERAKRGKMQKAQGTLLSAKPDGEMINLKIGLADGGEKEFQMSAQVVVVYAERRGEKRAIMIRAAGRKAPEPKGKTQVAQGKFGKADSKDGNLEVTVAVGEGAEAQDLVVTLPSSVMVMYREAKEGKPTAMMIRAARRPGKGPRKERRDTGAKVEK